MSAMTCTKRFDLLLAFLKRVSNLRQVVEMDLFEAGFDIEWEDIAVPDLSAAGNWDGVKRPYWTLDTYRLPTCKFMP